MYLVRLYKEIKIDYIQGSTGEIVKKAAGSYKCSGDASDISPQIDSEAHKSKAIQMIKKTFIKSLGLICTKHCHFLASLFELLTTTTK